MVHARVMEDLACELGMTRGNENEFEAARCYDRLQFVLTDVVCFAFISLEHKAVTLIVHHDIVLAKLSKGVLDTVAWEMQPNWVISHSVLESLYSTMHLFDKNRVAGFPEAWDGALELLAVV